ncbi:MAG: hypothetical protein JW878_02660 [Methanomicrobia archaeon]|nr:hypothetical protein [Methanomicrobia archaeon]
MEDEKKKIWAWLMPSGKIYKVVSNPAGGTIRIYNQNGTLVKEYEALSEAAVNVIEQNFLETVATVVHGKEPDADTKTKDAIADELSYYIR